MSLDLRKYARQTNFRLLVGFIALLLFIGTGLIWIIWGSGAAIFGVLCIAGGLLPLALIWAALAGIEWFVKRSREE